MSIPEKCPVCWEPLASAYFTSGCGHSFHRSCIRKYASMSPHLICPCPLCRAPMEHVDAKMLLEEKIVYATVPPDYYACDRCGTGPFAHDERESHYCLTGVRDTPKRTRMTPTFTPFTGAFPTLNWTVALEPKTQTTSLLVVTATAPEKGTIGNGSQVEARLPVDLVLVVDASGSMLRHMDELKKVLKFILSQQCNEDRLALITFNQDSKIVFGLRNGSKGTEREHMSELIDGILPDGGTDIPRAFIAALDLIHGRQYGRDVAPRIFLLTDGHNQYPMPDKSYYETELKRAEYPAVNCFGFGKHHDAAGIKTIADACQNTYKYIATTANLAQDFGNSLGETHSVCARHLKITVQSNNHDLRHTDRIFTAPNICYGEKKDFVMEVPFATPADWGVLTTECLAFFPNRTTSITRTTHTITASELRTNPPDIAFNRIIAAQAMEQSVMFMQASDLKSSASTLTRAITQLTNSYTSNHPTTLALIDDLTTSIADAMLQSPATILDRASSHLSQRNNSYQTTLQRTSSSNASSYVLQSPENP